MKKYLLICALLFSIPSVKADFATYYNFSDNLNVKFIPHEEKIEDKNLRAEYRKIEKNEKYISRKKYARAQKYMPDYIPNLARFIHAYSFEKDYIEALNFALKLKEKDVDNLFSQEDKDYRIGVLFALNNDYKNSNRYLFPYVDSNSWASFQVAQNLYYLRDYISSESYASKIKATEEAFVPAQELLFTLYAQLDNSQKAYRVAKTLIKYDVGNPQNYLNLATVTTNRDEKIINYYRAKQIYQAQGLVNMVKEINNILAPLEQDKIDVAYKKITSYCKKPDWSKIKIRNEKLISLDDNYWNKRQEEFFESTNDCIKRYYGNNLVACFKDVNSTQENLDKLLIEENSRILEAQQREVQIRQIMRQNMLLEEQNQIQRFNYYNRYNNRYYRPYWW